MENSTLGPNPPPIEMEKNKVIFSETTPALFVKGVFSPLKIPNFLLLRCQYMPWHMQWQPQFSPWHGYVTLVCVYEP